MKRSPTPIALAVAATLFVTLGEARAADPTTADCLAASDASLKSGNEQKLRAERSQLLICAAESCPADVRKECLRRAEEVSPQIPTIIFAAKDPSGADLSAVKVTMDGELLAERLAGTALSIDPGEHEFLFETAGQSAVTRRLIIQQAQKDRRETISFGTPAIAAAAAPQAPSSAARVPPPGMDAGEGAHEGDRRDGWGAQKVVAVVIGGLGVVGLGVGTAFGALAMSKKSDASAVCPDVCATQDGASKWSDAKSAGTISTIAFAAGGVAVAGAALLWFTAPSSPSGGLSAQLGLGPGALHVRGSW
jgi:hypothetical protein